MIDDIGNGDQQLAFTHKIGKSARQVIEAARTVAIDAEDQRGRGIVKIDRDEGAGDVAATDKGPMPLNNDGAGATGDRLVADLNQARMTQIVHAQAALASNEQPGVVEHGEAFCGANSRRGVETDRRARRAHRDARDAEVGRKVRDAVVDDEVVDGFFVELKARRQ